MWKRERVVHDGTSYHIPLPEGQGTGLGKPLKLINHPLRADIPIYVASLGPKNVEMTAEVADGWMPLFYLPEKAERRVGRRPRRRRGQARRRPRARSRSWPAACWPSATAPRQCASSPAR